MKFIGGESAAVGRVHEYFWKKVRMNFHHVPVYACAYQRSSNIDSNTHLQDLLRVYKETRNGMLGPDYSTKFSPWLASGSLSPRYIYEEVDEFDRYHYCCLFYIENNETNVEHLIHVISSGKEIWKGKACQWFHLLVCISLSQNYSKTLIYM